MNFEGLVIGVCTFLIIGLFHPIVIKAEYYFGVKVWWVFLLLGLAGVGGSLVVANTLLSTLLGVFALDQRERVRKGWFPKNPKRE